MSRMLFLEGFSGISGDMTVAALLALGGNQQKLEKTLQSLQLDDEFSVSITQGKSRGIAGTNFSVFCKKDHPHHHEHDHHHEHEHEHHEHEHEHEHEHGHGHHHHGHGHEHIHRNLSDVFAIIDRADMSSTACSLAKKIFTVVAEAEAAAHGCNINEVHFHEVGAIDSIVDIISAAVLIDDLQITQCVVEALSEGCGTVCCQHGELPVPVPAVLNIAASHHIALRRTAVQGEMVTPTGIAIAAALKTTDKLPEQYNICSVGIGVGKKEFPHANILRAMLIEPVETAKSNDVFLMECNIDDSSGESLGLAMEKLLAAGALDVHFTPCFMKKNRPAYILSCIAPGDKIAELERLIFMHTSTIGIRHSQLKRSCMQRQIIQINTQYGPIDVKKCLWQDIVKFYPEYESVKAAADKNNVDFQQVFTAAAAGCKA